MSPPSQLFPFDLFAVSRFQNDSRDLTRRIAELSELCLSSSYPWGHWLFGKADREANALARGRVRRVWRRKRRDGAVFGEYARRLGGKVYALDTFADLGAPSALRDNAYFRERDYGSQDESTDLLLHVTSAVKNFGLSGVIHPMQGLINRFSFPFGKELSKLDQGRSRESLNTPKVTN
jgi:hypothetical protein